MKRFKAVCTFNGCNFVDDQLYDKASAKQAASEHINHWEERTGEYPNSRHVVHITKYYVVSE